METTSLPDELLAGLRDIRLPDAASGGLAAEMAAALGLGLLVACALSFLIPLISRRSDQQTDLDGDQLDQILLLPEDQRSLALLYLIRKTDPPATQALRERLYQRETFPTLRELEDLVKQTSARTNA